MILQARRPPVFVCANSRHTRALTSKTLETEYWQNGSLKRRKLADGFWTGISSYDPAGRLLALDNDSSGMGLESGTLT